MFLISKSYLFYVSSFSSSSSSFPPALPPFSRPLPPHPPLPPNPPLTPPPLPRRPPPYHHHVGGSQIQPTWKRSWGKWKILPSCTIVAAPFSCNSILRWPFPYFFPTFYGDLGPNKAYKTSTEIFYTTCRKLWHLEKYSTLFVENCDRPTDGRTDRPTKLGTEALIPELKNIFVIISYGLITIIL